MTLARTGNRIAAQHHRHPDPRAECAHAGAAVLAALPVYGAHRNAAQVRYDPDFNADIQHVFRAIETVIPALAGRAGATIPTQVNTGIPHTSYASPYTSPPSARSVAASDNLWRPTHPWLVALGPIDALLLVATAWFFLKDSGFNYASGVITTVIALMGATTLFVSALFIAARRRHWGWVVGLTIFDLIATGISLYMGSVTTYYGYLPMACVGVSVCVFGLFARSNSPKK
ncbi:MAG: hypothetical protein ABI068_17120 [Ktedonobacterales bacterium]